MKKQNLAITKKENKIKNWKCLRKIAFIVFGAEKADVYLCNRAKNNPEILIIIHLALQVTEINS